MGNHDKRLSLPRLMAQLSIEDIEDFAEIFGFETPQWNAKDGGKAKRWFAHQIVCHPEDVLNKLPLSDLVMMENIIDNDSGMRANTTHTTIYACVLGLIDFHTDGEYDYFDMPPELIKAFAPYVTNVVDDVRNKMRFIMENLLLGLTNLYGRVTRGEYLKQISKHFDFDEGGNVREFYGWLRDNSVLIHFDDWGDDDSAKGDDDVVFYSPFMWDDVDAFERHVKKINREPFSKDEIIEAGKYPTPTIETPYNQDVERMLEKDFKLKGDEISTVLFEIWWRLQHEDAPDFEESNCKDYILHELIPTASPERGGADVLLRMLQTFMNYCNGIPRWTLRGRCPKEIG